MPAYSESPGATDAPESARLFRGVYQTRSLADGSSRQSPTGLADREDSLATAMRTHPTFLHLSVAPKCAWPKRVPSTALFARLTALASAPSKSSDRNRGLLVRPIRRDPYPLQITAVIRMGTLASAIAFVF